MINQIIKKYNEVGETATGKGDDYRAGCLLDYDYLTKITN